jgi:hypothetical protein
MIFLLLVAFTRGATDATRKRSVALEHVYCDPLTPEELKTLVDAGSSNRSMVGIPSMVAKAKCKGASCPSLDGKRVVIEDCRWPSVNDRAVYVEETSGWYFFYLDAERTNPLRPSEAELRALHSGEVGYLRQRCGVLTWGEPVR